VLEALHQAARSSFGCLNGRQRLRRADSQLPYVRHSDMRRYAYLVCSTKLHIVEACGGNAAAAVTSSRRPRRRQRH
jgi:hypothetical protein